MTDSAGDQIRICAAGFLRSLVVGMTGVLLVVYLSGSGWSIQKASLLVTVGLAGAALATLVVSLAADRLGRRRALVVLAFLTAIGPLALAVRTRPSLLLVLAFLSMLNALGRDRGAAYALEQALLPATATPQRRTFLLAWYGLVLDGGLALGSLLASVPSLLRAHRHWQADNAYAAVWLFAAMLALASTLLYATLSSRVEVANSAEARDVGWRRFLPQVGRESRRRIAGLASLTGMDSLGGGFLTGALVSYWFFRRFALGEQWLGPLFFAARLLNAGSHLAAAWLARRIGLLNTMVFTHIPSSLFLIAVPFAPSAGWAAALFLARESLVEMDVPTRASYILAVVKPEERAFASGITTLTRNIAYAVAPVGAGLAMSELALASPLFLGGGMKIAYDILLYVSFRHIRPPEELGQ